MYIVDMYLRVRRACLVEGMGIREASRVFGLHRDTVRKMLSHPVPPGYELISEVVEIEKAQVTERAYPPGITNRR